MGQSKGSRMVDNKGRNERRLQCKCHECQRLAKGCLVLVEGTWFKENSVLTELSGVVDSVTGETFEILREMSPQLDAAWGTASTGMKMVLKTEQQHQTSIWERLIMAAMERLQTAMLTWHVKQKHTKRMFSNEDRSMTRSEIRDSQCPEQNCLKLRKWNRKNWIIFVLPGMTDAEQLLKKEWLQIPRQARQAL